MLSSSPSAANNVLRPLLVTILVILAALYIYTDKQEEFYRQYAIPEIETILFEISDWNEGSLREHLSKETKDSIDAKQMSTLLAQYRPLGKFVSIKHLEFSKLVSAMSLFSKDRISYQGIVEFDSGLSDVTITLLKKDRTYQIYNLNIKLDSNS